MRTRTDTVIFRLGFTLAVHKKGSRLLVVRPLQNPGTSKGCIGEM